MGSPSAACMLCHAITVMCSCPVTAMKDPERNSSNRDSTWLLLERNTAYQWRMEIIGPFCSRRNDALGMWVQGRIR
ncbi:MAG TPA: hypothetical protein PKM72_04155 [Nitrospirales bacterium]|nr:hypothetical protein [Nitrospirales bacterium]